MSEVTSELNWQTPTRMMPLYEIYANALAAIANCEKLGDRQEWIERWQRLILDCDRQLPRGGGFDDYPRLYHKSKSDKLEFIGGFHKMDENGSYDGWIEYRVIVKPEFIKGISVNVKGVPKKYDDIADLIYEWFDYVLKEEFDFNAMLDSSPLEPRT